MDLQDREEPVIGFDKLLTIKVEDIKWIALRALVLGIVLYFLQHHLIPQPNLKKDIAFFIISYLIGFFLVFRWWYWSPRR